MALAIHEGGPADGQKVETDQVAQVRYHAPADARKTRGWVDLARYVFVPPRDGRRCRYHWTGVHQQRGPVPGLADAPEWSHG